MDSGANDEAEYSDFVEVDPTGRYGRYNEILGKGASKTVYRAFDEYKGIEVAWNQVKLYDFLQSPEDLERLYCEIHLLKTLKHENIMKFYTSWVDTTNRNINFVTEMFTSGTLRQYRLKHRNVNVRAVKHWCRQILKGLLYLHSHDPPVIHRDLKCDNIFINGNQGQVKIGDLGLAAILRQSHAVRCVGTPEFMAPEVYAEAYNELVDIYSFGMCILEMVTYEYPYSECTHPAQIYKKVISGNKPEALYKVKDPEVRQFVEKCLATVSLRLSARELLQDPFLQIDDYGFITNTLRYDLDFSYSGQPCNGIHESGDYGGYCAIEPQSEFDYHKVDDDLFVCQEDDNLEDNEITIKGRRREDEGIFLRLRIADKEGRVRNIYFPFDIETDTAVSVANEMVHELDMSDQDVTQIADMINSEIASLLPEWKRETGKVEISNCTNTGVCQDCASDSNFPDYVSSNGPRAKNLQVLNCSRSGYTAAHGRFEEITYKVEGSEQQRGPLVSAGQGFQYTDIWAQRDKPDITSEGSRDIHYDEALESSKEPNLTRGDGTINANGERGENTRKCSSDHADYTLLDDSENEIRQELRWLKAKYQLQLRELKNQQLRVQSKVPSTPPKDKSFQLERGNDSSSSRLSNSMKLKLQKKKPLLGPSNTRKQIASCSTDWDNIKRQMEQDAENTNEYIWSDHCPASNDLYREALLPQTLQRATSLPVDAVDV